ncbi:hypothetical protein CMUS01_10979 [Colletotrichum musicola]|uniref:Uncharacterized protein n=1 Tax=Colletotrichum musicola TaxID=2175873 RepID=A0A8H6N7V8_9PEZI|nr:hypothetical protein CMUS01_10979 [Colletotrichum musicola]
MVSAADTSQGQKEDATAATAPEVSLVNCRRSRWTSQPADYFGASGWRRYPPRMSVLRHTLGVGYPGPACLYRRQRAATPGFHIDNPDGTVQRRGTMYAAIYPGARETSYPVQEMGAAQGAADKTVTPKSAKEDCTGAKVGSRVQVPVGAQGGSENKTPRSNWSSRPVVAKAILLSDLSAEKVAKMPSM